MSEKIKKSRWQIMLILGLVTASVVMYLIHYIIFRDFHHIMLYLIGDIAFLPIEVLLVTLVLHRILEEQERRNMLEKLNMVIGVFFSEVGNKLLIEFSCMDERIEQLKSDLLKNNSWDQIDFNRAHGILHHYSGEVTADHKNLIRLQELFKGKKEFMLRLIENPNLLEHEKFTGMLMAVFHLAEELISRTDLESSSDVDIKHIEKDIKRVYISLIDQWLDYMEHLKYNYAYLFSLAIRMNPLDNSASPVIRSS